MKPSLRDYLYFSKAQRRSLVLLIFLILLTTFLIDQIKSSSEKEELVYHLSTFSTESHPKQEKQLDIAERQLSEKKNSLFNFNPNTLELEGWMKLGLSEKQARAILNYKEKGGQFRTQSDLKRMYTISEEKYLELLPYIQLPKEIEIKSSEELKETIEEKKPLFLDLNTADSAALCRLRGIGPVYASRIVKYRRLLGGYRSKEQLNEVWGLSDSTVEVIGRYLVLENNALVKIDINAAGEKELAKHPYIGWATARAIVNYRKQHGDYKSLEEIKKIYSINDSLYRRIFPYLEVAKNKP